jgi:hypothetical protein
LIHRLWHGVEGVRLFLAALEAIPYGAMLREGMAL